MNLEELHAEGKEVSAVKIFNGEKGIVSSIQLKKDGILKEHITKTPALLLCVTGRIIYHEADREIEMLVGDYTEIKPDVKHWLSGLEDSHLILIK